MVSFKKIDFGGWMLRGGGGVRKKRPKDALHDKINFSAFPLSNHFHSFLLNQAYACATWTVVLIFICCLGVNRATQI